MFVVQRAFTCNSNAKLTMLLKPLQFKCQNDCADTAHLFAATTNTIENSMLNLPRNRRAVTECLQDHCVQNNLAGLVFQFPAQIWRILQMTSQDPVWV